MKTFGITVLVFCVGAGLFGQEISGVIRDLNGTVEIKAPNSTVWVPARRGDVLRQDTVISTGFRSRALITLGNSLVTVWALTRVSLAELTGRSGNDEVRVDLRFGRIRAGVRPPAGGSVDFTVRSPMATSSVRGTVFDFDTVNLNVQEGMVAFSTPGSAALLVRAGSGSFVDETTETTAPPITVTARELTPVLPPGTGLRLPTAAGGSTSSSTGSGSSAGAGSPPPPSGGNGSFTVDLNW